MLSVRIVIATVLSLSSPWAAGVSAAPQPANPRQDVTVSAELQQLVDAYFSTARKDERKELVPSIEHSARHDPRAVAKALKRVDAWSAVQEGAVNIFFAGPGQPTVAAVYEAPLGYTSDQAYPMMLCIPDAGLGPEVMLAQAHRFLGDHVDEFVIAATTAEIAGTFQQTAGNRSKLRDLVKRLRKLVHTDTNRLYLLGVGTGADAAWLAAIRNPDLFAGVIAINGYPNVPYPKQAYPLLLESLRYVPVLSVWNEPAPAPGGEQERAAAVAKHNKFIAQLAATASLPIRLLKMPNTPSASVSPPVDAVSEIVTLDRMVAPLKMDHWFRYHEHGRTSWLRQMRFAGDVWEEAALSIATGAGADRHAFITGVLREKMAYLGGTVEGQTVTLQVKRTSGVEIMLPLGVLDPAKKVKVVCNGRTRHEGRLPPAIDVMLEDAYEHWEFQAPAAVRLSLSVKGEN